MKKQLENEDCAVQVQEVKKYNFAKMRRGAGLFDLILWIVLVGIVLGGLFSVFGKNFFTLTADGEHKKVISVMGGVENSRRLQGGTYIAQTAKVLTDATMANLINALGGVNNMKDVQDWTYTCANGAGQNLSITTSAYEDNVVRDSVISLIQNNNRPWTAVAAGNAIKFTKPNVICRN